TSSPERPAPVLPAAPEAAVVLFEPPQAARPIVAAAAPAASRNERREIFFMVCSSQITRVSCDTNDLQKGRRRVWVRRPFAGLAACAAVPCFRNIVYRFLYPENRRKGWIS